MAYPEALDVNGPIGYKGASCSPEKFAEECATLVEGGAQIIGGCCGTGIAHIEALATKLGR